MGYFTPPTTPCGTVTEKSHASVDPLPLHFTWYMDHRRLPPPEVSRPVLLPYHVYEFVAPFDKSAVPLN